MAKPSSEVQTVLSTPFVDLGPSCRPLNEGILADVAELLDSGRFHYGPQVMEPAPNNFTSAQY